MKKLFSFAAVLLVGLGLAWAAFFEINKVEKIADGVYWHEGDIRQGHCNNGWIVLDDYVVVIDGNFPSGAKLILPKIRQTSDKPIRFAFDTHHHGDHAYGNQVWAEAGATPIAHEGVLLEMKKYETGLFGDKPGRWEEAAKGRKDVAESKLKPPSLLYKTEMIFDDGKQRIELLHFGVAHTHGDGFAWLPKERILFTGDACVNGPYNYVSDGNAEEWIKTLEAVKKLKPRIVCPGHGPMGGPELLDDQQMYFIELRAEVKKMVEAGLTPDQAKAAAPAVKETLLKNERIRKYVGQFIDGQVEKVWVEMGGKAFAGTTKSAREAHARAHGHEHPHVVAARSATDK